MNDSAFRVKYWARRSLLTIWGPAQLGSGSDPLQQLERERDARFGPRPPKPAKALPPKKRSFTSSQQAR